MQAFYILVKKKHFICHINYTGFEFICCNLPAKLSVISLRNLLPIKVICLKICNTSLELRSDNELNYNMTSSDFTHSGITPLTGYH